ncbi:rubredoxin [bacterium]|nr:rubredoxin [bacterium]
MKKYQCKVCGYTYNPAMGDALRDVPPGTPFEELDDDWTCPMCGADKSKFVAKK